MPASSTPALQGLGWRRRSGRLILDKLDEIFPGHGIAPGDVVGDLSIGRRQMVEIARAFSVTDTPVSLVILDEPTSSLDAHVAGQLLAFVRRFVAGGGACILISHLLGEILSHREPHHRHARRQGRRRTAGGRIHARHRSSRRWAASPRARRPQPRQHGSKRRAGAPRARARPPAQTDGRELTAYRGEVVGLAGLAGQGQTEMLRRLFDAARRRAATPPSRSRSRWSPATARPTASFRSGRSRKNITVGSMRAMLRGILIDPQREAAMAETWRERINIRTPDVDNNILSLSGGNQQKALFARALGSDAGIVLMDDPMRGVDIGTKQEVYAMIRAEAERRPHLHLVHDRDGRAARTATTSTSSATAASSPTSRATS